VCTVNIERDTETRPSAIMDFITKLNTVFEGVLMSSGALPCFLRCLCGVFQEPEAFTEYIFRNAEDKLLRTLIAGAVKN